MSSIAVPLEPAVLREVVLTGGPCGGKSTVIPEVAAALRELGWNVMVVPEVARLVLDGGARFAGRGSGWSHALQEELLVLQLAARERFTSAAERLLGRPLVLLYDRAECDDAAYVSRRAFDVLLHRHGLRFDEVRDRYDVVVHLTSLAVDGPDSYLRIGGRSEGPAAAAALDAATFGAWAGHRHHVVVGNGDGFETKCRAVTQAVLDAVGDPPLR